VLDILLLYYQTNRVIIGSDARLKAITVVDEITINPKHKQPYSCKIPAVVLVIKNEAMRFNE